MEKRKFYIKIAHFYYVLKLTQDEIAKRFSISRQKVNQIINQLEDMQIVSIKINGYENRDFILENTIETEFNLKHVLVASVSDDFTPENVMNEVTSLAASCLDVFLPQKKRIGVSFSRTLSKTVQKMEYKKNANGHVVQMFGVQNALSDSTKDSTVAHLLAEKLDCTCYTMYSPGIVSSAELRNMLLKEKPIRDYFDYLTTCDAALVGIGSIDSDTFIRQNFFAEAEIEQLRSTGFHSVICLNPIRDDGSWHDCPLSDRIIGIDIPTLRKIPDVIAVSANADKAKSIVSALRTGCIDTLIVDSRTAARICTLISPAAP